MSAGLPARSESAADGSAANQNAANQNAANQSALNKSPAAVRIHPTAIVEEGVEIGEGSAVWDNVHIRRGSRIGCESIIGGKTYIAYEVRIGSRVKINSFVYICNAVTIADGVMIGAGTVFTNDRFPRAATPNLDRLRPSEPDEHTLPTVVEEGASIGAQSTVGPDLTVGRWAMVGMGSVVTRSVPPFGLVVGNPARLRGFVCRCGPPVARFRSEGAAAADLVCASCGRRYHVDGERCVELD